MAVDEIGPVPPGLAAGAPSGEQPGILEWLTRLLDRVQRSATTTQEGGVKEAAAQSDSTATTVADLRADFNALLAKLRTSGVLDE